MPNIGTMKDLETLKKMREAGRSHLQRLTNEIEEMKAEGLMPPKSLVNQAVFVGQACLEVNLRVGELLANNK